MSDAQAPTPEEKMKSKGGIIRVVHPAPLRDVLSIDAWAAKDIAAPEKLLGDLVTRTSRTFLVGATGLGKTMLGIALGAGIASGAGFLHWRSERAARVLYIDGEMPAELIKVRSADAIRRSCKPILGGNLCIFARDVEDEFAKLYPDVGRMQPLNTSDGQDFVMRLISAIGGVEVVIFDNVMSLIAGDQREEVPWSETIPLVERLTKDRIAQVWLDHTGHNSSRQYGSSTKAWRFDSVGIMEPLAEADCSRHELAFTLSFEAPGKSRRRTPDNWRDFEPCTIRLAADCWTSEFAEGSETACKAVRPVSPEARLFHDALLDALVKTDRPGCTTRAAWTAEAIRRGLIDPATDGDTRAIKDRKDAKMRKYRSTLLTAQWIGIDGETVRSLVGGTPT